VCQGLLRGGVSPLGHDVVMDVQFREEHTISAGSTLLLIDCDNCSQDSTGACSDCVVTYLCGRQPGEAVVADLEERRAFSLLAGVGLVPPLRHAEKG